MLQYKSIAKRFNDPKDKTFARLIHLMNYLWRKRLYFDDCVKLRERIGIGYYKTTENIKIKNRQGEVLRTEKREVRRDYVFIGHLDSKNMEHVLKCSRGTIYQDMQDLWDVGILIKFWKSGPIDQMVYAIGYWSPFEGSKSRPLSFLRNTKKCRTTLANWKRDESQI